jgi:hypothetical protein
MHCGKLGLAQNTIVAFVSDNRPEGEVVRQFGGDMPDMGSPRPLPRRTGRCQRRLDPHRRADPLAGPDWAAIILRDVLDHGFFPDALVSRAARCPTIARSTASIRPPAARKEQPRAA